MRNHLKWILIICLTIAIQETEAQIRPGYIIGVNRSTFDIKSNNLTVNPETITGIHFGGVLDIPLNKNISFQPNLIFTAKGSNFKIDSTEFSLSPIYIELPLLVVCRFGSEYFSVSLSAGPYAACGVDGYKIISGGEMQEIKFGTGSEKDLKTLDAGFKFGAGINISGIMISVHYGIGLANIIPVSDSVLEMRNKVFEISVSSLFATR